MICFTSPVHVSVMRGQGGDALLNAMSWKDGFPPVDLILYLQTSFSRIEPAFQGEWYKHQHFREFLFIVLCGKGKETQLPEDRPPQGLRTVARLL